MKDGHGALTIGSEMSGGVRNVFAENCRLDSPNLNQALRFKTNAVRGGTIEHIYFRNIEVGQVAEAVLQIDFQYEEGENGPERPNVHDIDIRGVTCRKSKYALRSRGFRSAPIRDLRLTDCRFDRHRGAEHHRTRGGAHVRLTSRSAAQFSKAELVRRGICTAPQDIENREANTMATLAQTQTEQDDLPKDQRARGAAHLR